MAGNYPTLPLQGTTWLAITQHCHCRGQHGWQLPVTTAGDNMAGITSQNRREQHGRQLHVNNAIIVYYVFYNKLTF